MDRRTLAALTFATLVAVGTIARLEPQAESADGDTSPVGQVVAHARKEDKQTVAWRTGLSAPDTNTWAAVHASTRFRSFGRPNLTLSARFSASGANCHVVLYKARNSAADGISGTDTLLGVSHEVTLVAGSSLDANGKYIAPDYSFDTAGGYIGFIRIVSISGGTVDLWAGSF